MLGLNIRMSNRKEWPLSPFVSGGLIKDTMASLCLYGHLCAVCTLWELGSFLGLRESGHIEEVLPLPLWNSQILLLSSGALGGFPAQDRHRIGL